MEGTGTYGAALARYLRMVGLTVVEVDRPDRKSRRTHAQVRSPRRLCRRQGCAVGVGGRGAEAAGWPRRGDPGAPRGPLLAHLYDLVRTANEGARPQRRHGRARPLQVRPGVQQLIDTMDNVRVIVQNGRLDALATNTLGRALFSPMYDDQQSPANLARFVFLGSHSEPFFREWDDTAQQTVALLRTEAGRAPYDRALSDLVGELSTRCDAFRTLWASHDVRVHRTGTKQVHHPVVGDLDLTFEAMDLTSEPGLQLLAFSAPPRSSSDDGLRLLATWAATAQPDTSRAEPASTEALDHP